MQLSFELLLCSNLKLPNCASGINAAGSNQIHIKFVPIKTRQWSAVLGRPICVQEGFNSSIVISADLNKNLVLRKPLIVHSPSKVVDSPHLSPANRGSFPSDRVSTWASSLDTGGRTYSDEPVLPLLRPVEQCVSCSSTLQWNSTLPIGTSVKDPWRHSSHGRIMWTARYRRRSPSVGTRGHCFSVYPNY